ncbi:MAG: hypothetical protein AVO38_03345 [delta proteobacterium ML8_D]|nr:MAG: hypothetical protein AVO38_03345 [delta proteobacterium ML8_D]
MENKRDVMTLPGIVWRSAHEFEDRPALIARGPQRERVITFAELGIKVESMARGLIAHGLKKNAKCAILGPNSPEWAIAYLSITSAAGICVPIDTQLSKNEILHLISNAEADTVFAAPEFLDCLFDITEDFPKPRQVIVLTLDNQDIPCGAITFEELISKGQQKQCILPQRVPEDPAAIIYTSGTTGGPKGVILTHANIVSDITACYKSIGFNQEHFLSVLPMYHMFECTAGFLLPIYSGSTITFARSLKSLRILEDLKTSRATVIVSVPLLFRKMLDGIYNNISRAPFAQQMIFRILINTVKIGEKMGIKRLGMPLFKGLREQAGLSSLRFLVVGGAPLTAKIPREFRWLGIKMLQGYGLTEASPVLTFNPVDRPVDESIGKPLSGVEVKILEPDKTGVGELAFKGPMIIKGYHRAPEATREILDSDGWLKTGDLGYQDERGYLYICGRVKNLIVTPAGKNIYPEEIETEINLRPFVLESIVYGHEKENGEEIRAVIVPDYKAICKHSPEKHLSDKDIYKLIADEVKIVNQTLASFKRVKSFILTDEELPKTSTRKIKRYLIKKLHVIKK